MRSNLLTTESQEYILETESYSKRKPRKKEKFVKKSQASPHTIEGKTPNQKRLLALLKEKDQIFVFGPSGTGKTYITGKFAAIEYLAGNYEKIIITKPNVSASNSLGFLPGTLIEKATPWMTSISEVLQEVLGPVAYEIALKKGNIEMLPLEYARGRSIKNAVVVIEESQNLTLEDLQLILTRQGIGSKFIFNGDIKQVDLGRYKKMSGLPKILELIKKHNIDVGLVEFDIDDILRSGIVRQWVSAFYDEGIF